VVAATNRDLAEEVRSRRFREDLYYRLNVFPIRLPALRERKDGLPLLVDFLLSQAVVQTGRAVRGIEPAAMTKLLQYHWPGNIRELRNVIERAVILCKGEITLADLPDTMRMLGSGSDGGEAGSLRERERAMILQTLESCGNNRRLAAEQLGISRRTLQYRLKEYGLVEP
jgi:DNA-binding NtrC family response regulator